MKRAVTPRQWAAAAGTGLLVLLLLPWMAAAALFWTLVFRIRLARRGGLPPAQPEPVPLSPALEEDLARGGRAGTDRGGRASAPASPAVGDSDDSIDSIDSTLAGEIPP